MAIGAGSSEVLKALDKARTQWYHFTTIIIAGMGFFTDAYDLFCISCVARLLGRLYYHDPLSQKPGVLPPNVSAAVNGVALCGTFCGQLYFGWLGDRLGRKRVYGYTLVLMIITSLASGLSFGSSAKGVMSTLCFFRFWLGFGIGGDYPLSATIMSEYANQKTRGAFIAAVFAMQGVGIVAGATVSIIVASIFRRSYPSPSFEVDPLGSQPSQADYVWRIIFMFGAAPAALTFYYRMQMPETARYTALVIKNNRRAAQDMGRVLQVQFPVLVDAPVDHHRVPEYGLFTKRFMKRHGRELLGCTSTWFLLDVAFYSQNLFQKDIFTSVGWLPPQKTMSALEEVFKVSRAQALIALCSTVPGYWFTVAFIDIVGRWIIQLLGFFFMTLFMFILTFMYNDLRGDPCGSKYCGGSHVTFLVLYAFTFFFANFGPNATTFIIPAELFPARLRSTCHGISAAAGKAGAIVGAFGFLYAAQGKHQHTKEKGYPNGIGIKNAFLLLSLINLAGFFCTFLLPETKGKSLEDLSGENDEDQRDEGSIHHQFSLSKHPWNLEVAARPVEYLSTNERRVGYGT
jgi:PHS family inorganic phosphate transporter-like MFS transporter